jgi:L-rhamnose mutarotase
MTWQAHRPDSPSFAEVVQARMQCDRIRTWGNGRAFYNRRYRNYSIYLRQLPDGKHYLFSYMEYVGDDFEGDLKRLGANPEVQRWWKLTDPCQEPLADRKPGEWWAAMEEVCHQD